MAATASGIFSLFLSNAETLLANSSNFQTWTGTASVAAAKTRISLVEIDSGYTRPYALIRFEQSGGWSVDAIAGGSDVSWSAELVDLEIVFEATVSGDNDEDYAITFLNNIGAIVEDMKVLAGTDAYLAAQSFYIAENLKRIEQAQQTSGSAEDFLQIVIGLSVNATGF